MVSPLVSRSCTRRCRTFTTTASPWNKTPSLVRSSDLCSKGLRPFTAEFISASTNSTHHDCITHPQEPCINPCQHCGSSRECQGTYQGRHDGEAERVQNSGSGTHHAERHGIHHPTQELIMRNEFVDACIAMTLGTGLGFLLSVGGQKLLNQHYKRTCHQQPGHNLIYTQGFLGDTYYCINAKHMN